MTTIDRFHCTHLDDLPQQAQDEVRTTIHDVLSTDVDDVAANGTGRIESQRLILMNRESVELALVHCSLVNSVGD